MQGHNYDTKMWNTANVEAYWIIPSLKYWNLHSTETLLKFYGDIHGQMVYNGL